MLAYHFPALGTHTVLCRRRKFTFIPTTYPRHSCWRRPYRGSLDNPRCACRLLFPVCPQPTQLLQHWRRRMPHHYGSGRRLVLAMFVLPDLPTDFPTIPSLQKEGGGVRVSANMEYYRLLEWKKFLLPREPEPALCHVLLHFQTYPTWHSDYTSYHHTF